MTSLLWILPLFTTKSPGERSNRPIEKAKYDAIYSKVVAYLQNREIFVFDGFAGADTKYTKSFRIVNELASQNLFIHQLLRRPTEEVWKTPPRTSPSLLLLASSASPRSTAPAARRPSW